MQQIIANKIFFIRGQKVMFDKDLAELYGISTKRLKEQVRRNLKRFPQDFMLSLSKEECLRCQFGTASLRSQKAASSWGGSRYLPFAFTEQGVAMLSSVINSERAIQVNIQIMRAFVRLRRILQSNKELFKKIEAMEKKYDGQFRIVFAAIKELMAPSVEKEKKRIIGFRPNKP